MVEKVGLFLFHCFNLFPCNCDKALWQNSLTGKKSLLLLTVQGYSLPQQRAKGSKSLKHLVALHSQPGNRQQWMFLLSKISSLYSLQNPNFGNGITQFLCGYYHLNLIKTMPHSHSQPLTAVSGGLWFQVLSSWQRILEILFVVASEELLPIKFEIISFLSTYSQPSIFKLLLL